jgi:hypothetical protein
MHWQWQICCYQGATFYPASSYRDLNYVKTLSPPVAFYDIDGFENDNNASINPATGQPIGTVARIHAQGRRAICYIDAGSYEDWRPDLRGFRRAHPGLIGGRVPGWSHQWWLDFRATGVVYPIMRARMEMCRARGYDGIQFDDLVAYEPGSHQGFSPPITAAQTVAFGAWLANEAHRHGLSAAFENAIEIAPRLQPYYDRAIFEDCTQYHECFASGLESFLKAGKFVAAVEYTDNRGHDLSWCGNGSLDRGTVGMLKQRPLDAPRWPCPRASVGAAMRPQH